MTRMFLSPPDVGPEERRLLLDAFDSNWIAPLGPHVDAFEREFAAFVGVPVRGGAVERHGRAAPGAARARRRRGRRGPDLDDDVRGDGERRDLRRRGAGLRRRDARHLDDGPGSARGRAGGARGSGRSRWRRSSPSISTASAPTTSGSRRSAAHYGVPLIEDAAEALGAPTGSKHAGAFGECAAFSFNGNKIITTSGGGMLVSHRRDIVDRARHLSAQARDPAPHYEHSEIGYNYRLSNLLAAVGRGQLRSLPAKLERRRANNDSYRALLADQPGIRFHARSRRTDAPTAGSPASPSTSRCSAPRARPSACALEAENIESRPVWKPMHLQPVFRSCRDAGRAVANELFANGLCLPSGSSLTQHDRERVVGDDARGAGEKRGGLPCLTACRARPSSRCGSTAPFRFRRSSPSLSSRTPSRSCSGSTPTRRMGVGGVLADAALAGGGPRPDVHSLPPLRRPVAIHGHLRSAGPDRRRRRQLARLLPAACRRPSAPPSIPARSSSSTRSC